MNRIEQIKKQISGPYGVQALTEHDVLWLIQELEITENIAESDAWALIPRKFVLESGDIEMLLCHAESEPGVYDDVILWVGELVDDDGTTTYGLNVTSEQCPEEGSTALHAFARPPNQAHAANFAQSLEIRTLSEQLHCVTELLRAREREIAELKQSAHDAQPAEQPAPIPTSERLPTEADADPFGRVLAYVYGEWDVWHWRSVVRDPSPVTHWLPTGLRKPAEPRCRLCDNTGDIHTPTGEWRGECPYCKPAEPGEVG